MAKARFQFKPSNRVQLLFQAFYSIFLPLYRPDIKTFSILKEEHRGPYMKLMAKKLEETIAALQESLNGKMWNPSDLLDRAKSFPEDVRLAVKNTLRDAFGYLSNKSLKELEKYFFNEFYSHYGNFDLTNGQINEHLNEEEMLEMIERIFVPHELSKKTNYFKLIPMIPQSSSLSGSMSYFPILSTEEYFYLSFHITPDFAIGAPDGALLKCHHFHGLRALVFHELISHCVFDDLKKQEIVLDDLEEHHYFAHGWLMFYAQILSNELLISEISLYDNFHTGMDLEVSNFISELIGVEIKNPGQDQPTALTGYQHACNVFHALGNEEFHQHLNLDEFSVTDFGYELLRNSKALGFDNIERFEVQIDLFKQLLITVINSLLDSNINLDIEQATKILSRIGEAASLNATPRIEDGLVKSTLQTFFVGNLGGGISHALLDLAN